MWNYVLLLAVVAGSYACPEPCECRRIADREDLAILIEASCEGSAPRLVELSSNTRRLKLENGNESSVIEVIGGLSSVTGSFPYLNELFLVNCSVRTLNVSWDGLDRVRVLNLSGNSVEALEDIGLSSGSANLTGLTIFDLSWNFVRNLSSEAFEAVSNLARLSLKKNELSSIDERAFVGLGRLELLDLSDNRLNFIPKDALAPLSGLQNLDLSGNSLRILGAGWFESLGKLRELDVSRNGLVRAASGALQTLSGLAVLRLSENPLRERDVSLLLGSGRKLETVDASRTGLVRVPVALTRSVRVLRLAGNKLTAIRGGDLDSYPLIRLLDMSGNRLADVEDDALGRLEVLSELDVSGNLLTDVPRSLPSSLVTLNLEGNLVGILKSNDLRGLDNLRLLCLRNNAIREIQEGSLGQVPALESLDISDNPIKELPANTLDGPTGLTTLRMSGLTSLQWTRNAQSDMAFPVPGPERLVHLDVSRSPVLAEQLLSDRAALSACKSLLLLNLGQSNLTSLRADLVYVLPQLRSLGLGDNRWRCSENLYWLGEWSRLHEELGPPARCWEPATFNGTCLRELPSPPRPSLLPTTTTVDSSLKDQPSTSVTTVVASSSTDTPESNTIAAEDPMTLNLTSTLSNEASSSPTTVKSVEAIGKKTSSTALEKSATTIQQQKTTTTTTTKEPRSPGKSSRRLSSMNHRLNVFLPNVTLAKKILEKSDVTTKEIISREKTKDGSNALSRSREEEYQQDHPRNEGEARTKRKGAVPGDRDDLNDVADASLAEELKVFDVNAAATDSGARIAEPLSAGAHPGMLVLVGAALGAVAALSVILSHRATARRRRRDCYQRHENIEVHTLTPVTELW